MIQDGYLLGLDIGSSSVKASLITVATGKTVASAQSPADEMTMIALQPGWAEQNPGTWWEHTVSAIRAVIKKANPQAGSVRAIGISYQMHGLVVVDEQMKPLRPSIIWCDSRAVQIGNKAQDALGKDYCLANLLNAPGNFTASKLRWVQENEPVVYSKIFKMMLPGDFIAMKLSGEIVTTDTGLSEGIFWNYETKNTDQRLLDYFKIDPSLIPSRVPVFSVQGKLKGAAAAELGLSSGIPISYRAGDQPNNAFSLNVLQPGETAATAGTSGVIYSITDENAFDKNSRVNTFVHVNNTEEQKRNGVLLCVNGTGIQNSWLRKMLHANGVTYDYTAMNAMAGAVAIGSEGISVLPFGNGAERILENRELGSSIQGLNFNRHHQGHVLRAAQEGIVFALRYGFDILQEMGLSTSVIKAGNANMFLSPVFREAFANTIGARVELYDTDGAKGAAIGAGIGSGVYSNTKEAFAGLHLIGEERPVSEKQDAYGEAYHKWKQLLSHSF